MYTILVACDKNNLIGRNDRLVWKCPEDLRLFRHRTLDSVLIMGRKTYQSLPRKFIRKRITVVLSRQGVALPAVSSEVYGPFQFSNLTVVDLYLNAFHKNRRWFVIGGEEIYNEYLAEDMIDKIILSQIPGDYWGDKYFPEIDKNKFQLTDYRKYETFKEYIYYHIRKLH